MKQFAAITLVAVLAFSPITQASDRPDHFEGEPAASLEQALVNLTEHNARLATVLEKDSLAPADHDEIHQLTYTLENALKRIDGELDGMAEKLELIHEASEERDSETIRDQAPGYLSATGKLTNR